MDWNAWLGLSWTYTERGGSSENKLSEPNEKDIFKLPEGFPIEYSISN